MLGDSNVALATPLTNGWTVAATLAHIAFWDRFTLARWRRLSEQGVRPVRVPDLLDLMNETALPQWMALAGAEASRQELEAAEAVDDVISAAPVELAHEMAQSGFDGMLDRARIAAATWPRLSRRSGSRASNDTDEVRLRPPWLDLKDRAGQTGRLGGRSRRQTDSHDGDLAPARNSGSLQQRS